MVTNAHAMRGTLKSSNMLGICWMKILAMR
jgi:hypothetical protein